MNIAVSAGHYPESPGACDDEFCEHGEAVLWSKQILKELGGKGVYVPTGYLERKTNYINRIDPTIAVEIHFNSYKIWEDANRDGLITDDELKHAGGGCETLHYPGSTKGTFLAEAVQRSIAPVIFRNRGIKPGYYRMNPKNGPDFFLAKTYCPSIIIEPDFIHRKEYIRNNRNEACGLIADALLKVVGDFK